MRKIGKQYRNYLKWLRIKYKMNEGLIKILDNIIIAQINEIKGMLEL
jgi:hypothetical protein